MSPDMKLANVENCDGIVLAGDTPPQEGGGSTGARAGGDVWRERGGELRGSPHPGQAAQRCRTPAA